jgi:cbb3-type cytochrome oxidase subunit 3
MDLINWMVRHSILLTLPVFLMLLASLYWPGRRARVERHALIPLDDDR